MSGLTSICFTVELIVSFVFSNNLIAVKENNILANASETIDVLDKKDRGNDSISTTGVLKHVNDVAEVTNITDEIINNALENVTHKNGVLSIRDVTEDRLSNTLEKAVDDVSASITHDDNEFVVLREETTGTIINVSMPPTDGLNKTMDITITIEKDIWPFDGPIQETSLAISKSTDKNTSMDTLLKTPLEFWTVDMVKIHGNRALCEFCGRLCSRKYLELKDPFKPYEIECLQCSCDMDCHRYGDCCLHDPHKAPESLYRCKGNVENSIVNPPVYIRRPQCSDNWADNETRGLCEKSSSCRHLPVTTKLGVTYHNKYCAICNTEDEYTNWNLDFEVGDDFKYYRQVKTFIESIVECKAKLFVKPPSEIRNHKPCDRRRGYDVIDKCNVTGLWADYNDTLEKNCLKHHTPFYYKGDKKVYQNMYCFLCNGRWFKYGIALGNNEDINLTRMIPEIRLKTLEDFRGPTCNATWRFYNPHQNSCKTIECSHHLEYKGKECVPLNNDSKILHFMLNISSITNIRHKIKTSLKKLGIHRYIITLGVIQQNIYLHFFSHSKFQNAAKLLSLVKSNWTFGSHVTVTDYLSFNKWTKIWVMISDDVYMSCCKGNINSTDQKTITFEISDFNLCPYVVYDEAEFESVENDTLKLRLMDTDLTFKKEEYQRQGLQKFIICINTIKDKFHVFSTKRTYYDPFKSKHIEVLQNIMSTLSLACLILTFLTYLKFPVLRTTPAKNNMALVICLFFAQLALIAATYLKSGTAICKVIGILVHYSWLSVFFWMNVCSFHMFTVFRSANVYSLPPSGHWKRLLKYFLFANGTPVMIVSTVIMVSVITTNTVGYGDQQCYLDNILYVGIGTILPLLIVIGLNLFFLGMTIHDISRAANIAKASGKDRQHMKVYLKLSTLTGLFWTFEILSNFFLTEVLIILSALFNYGQGILIFLSYVANKRVAKLWLDLCCGKLRE